MLQPSISRWWWLQRKRHRASPRRTTVILDSGARDTSKPRARSSAVSFASAAGCSASGRWRQSWTMNGSVACECTTWSGDSRPSHTNAVRRMGLRSTADCHVRWSSAMSTSEWLDQPACSK
nr:MULTISPECIES: hypothetical protein [Corallococcus]